MKKWISLLLCFSTIVSKAQMLDGSIAPDFTFNDINGNPHNLYSYLNMNRFVLLEISATWCAPCWVMHDSFHVLNQVYDAYDTPGDQTGKVLFLEADSSTGLSDLQGSGPATLGDWISGTNYPILNPSGTPQIGETTLADFGVDYPLSGMPKLIMICPNKKVWIDTLNNDDKVTPWPPPLATIQWLSNTKCNLPSALDEWDVGNSFTVYVPKGNDKINLLFSINKSTEVYIKLLNCFGQVVVTLPMMNLQAGDHSINMPVSQLVNGVYVLQLATNGGRVIAKKVMLAR